MHDVTFAVMLSPSNPVPWHPDLSFFGCQWLCFDSDFVNCFHIVLKLRSFWRILISFMSKEQVFDLSTLF
jgi:hypothetical protein